MVVGGPELPVAGFPTASEGVDQLRQEPANVFGPTQGSAMSSLVDEPKTTGDFELNLDLCLREDWSVHRLAHDVDSLLLVRIIILIRLVFFGTLSCVSLGFSNSLSKSSFQVEAVDVDAWIMELLAERRDSQKDVAQRCCLEFLFCQHGR